MTQETKAVDTQMQHIRALLDGRVEHFADRSVRRLLQNGENVRGVLEIVAADIAERIDFSQLVPLPRSLLPEVLREQEADSVFRVPFRTETATEALLIYLLVEHQSTVDATMGFRVLFYMMLIWDAHRRQWEHDKVPKPARRLPPILPIVFYTGEREWKTPLTLEALMDIPAELARFVPAFETLFLSVKQTDVATLTQTHHPFGWLLTVLQKERADEAEIRDALRTAIAHLDEFDTVGAEQRREAIVYFLLLILHRRPLSEQSGLVTLVEQLAEDKMEVKQMAETMAEVLVQQGLKQGIEQGIEQGARRNAIENVITVLTARFPQSDVQTTQPHLEAIPDLVRLKQLHLIAVETPSFEAFLQALHT